MRSEMPNSWSSRCVRAATLSSSGMAQPSRIRRIPTPFNFDNIAKQRNLNAKGKELAKAFGGAVRQVGIPAGKVYSSNFNRAFETAVLAGFNDIEKDRRPDGGRARRVTRRK